MMVVGGFELKNSHSQRSKGLLRGGAGGGGNATQLPSYELCQGWKGKTTILPCLDTSGEVIRGLELEKGILSLIRRLAPSLIDRWLASEYYRRNMKKSAVRLEEVAIKGNRQVLRLAAVAFGAWCDFQILY